MTAVKRAVLLLLLLLSEAVGSGAETDGCDGPQHLQTAQLDKIFGDWVLVWSVADNSSVPVDQISSSHVELRLLPDNTTIQYNERNLSNTSSCTSYFMNVTADPQAENLTLHTQPIIKEENGVKQHYNESVEVEFYETCEDCLMMVFRASESGRYLLTYRREGSHRDVDRQRAAHADLKKMAECLKFPTDKQFIYDGVSGFCGKKSAAEAKPEEA